MPHSPYNTVSSIARRQPWTILQGDSIDLLSTLSASSVDLVFADPPYRLSNGGTTCHGGRRAVVDKGTWDSSRGHELDHAYNRRWLTALQRVLKPTGTIWVSGTQHIIFSIGYAMQELGFHLLNTITWYKTNAAPNLSCRFFTHSTELLIWASPQRTKPLLHHFNYATMKAVTGRQMRDLWEMTERPEPGGKQVVWSIPTPGPREKTYGRHPTQKPLALLGRILAASAEPGDLVLDPFSGSGTTGVAAIRAGCRFIGIEREPEFVTLSRRRLMAAFQADDHR